jgi:putative membrane protein
LSFDNKAYATPALINEQIVKKTMIIRKQENWFRMLFIWEGSVLPRILPRLSMLFLLTLVVAYFRGTIFSYKIQLNPGPFTLFGIALAIFLGFRNSVSFDRFWEGRKLWGSLLNTTRSLSRQAQTLTTLDPKGETISTFVNFLIAFTYCCKHQLRHTDAYQDLQRLLGQTKADEMRTATYIPNLLVLEMGIWLRTARTKALLDPLLLSSMDHNLNELSNIIGGCERIASTPIPYTYKVLLHRTVYFYCFLLPFGFVDSLGWMMPIIVTFIAYTFVALEAVADELEDPFGLEPNDLALNALCNMIENTLLEMSGKPLIHPLKSNGYMLT